MTHFADRCYDLLLNVPKGYVVTYKDIATALDSRAYRAVGQAMRNNPRLPEVPCHRVVNEDGRLGGYRYGLDAKIALLKKEGVDVKENRIVDFSARKWQFDQS